jgi:hypothetical protein
VEIEILDPGERTFECVKARENNSMQGTQGYFGAENNASGLPAVAQYGTSVGNEAAVLLSQRRDAAAVAASGYAPFSSAV